MRNLALKQLRATPVFFRSYEAIRVADDYLARLALPADHPLQDHLKTATNALLSLATPQALKYMDQTAIQDQLTTLFKSVNAIQAAAVTLPGTLSPDQIDEVRSLQSKLSDFVSRGFSERHTLIKFEVINRVVKLSLPVPFRTETLRDLTSLAKTISETQAKLDSLAPAYDALLSQYAKFKLNETDLTRMNDAIPVTDPARVSDTELCQSIAAQFEKLKMNQDFSVIGNVVKNITLRLKIMLSGLTLKRALLGGAGLALRTGLSPLIGLIGILNTAVKLVKHLRHFSDSFKDPDIRHASPAQKRALMAIQIGINAASVVKNLGSNIWDMAFLPSLAVPALLPVTAVAALMVLSSSAALVGLSYASTRIWKSVYLKSFTNVTHSINADTNRLSESVSSIKRSVSEQNERRSEIRKTERIADDLGKQIENAETAANMAMMHAGVTVLNVVDGMIAGLLVGLSHSALSDLGKTDAMVSRRVQKTAAETLSLFRFSSQVPNSRGVSKNYKMLATVSELMAEKNAYVFPSANRALIPARWQRLAKKALLEKRAEELGLR